MDEERREGGRGHLRLVGGAADEPLLESRDRDFDEECHQVLQEINFYFRNVENINSLLDKNLESDNLALLKVILEQCARFFNVGFFERLAKERFMSRAFKHDLGGVSAPAQGYYDLLLGELRQPVNKMDREKIKNQLIDFRKYSVAYAMVMQDLILRRLRREDEFRGQRFRLSRGNFRMLFEEAFLVGSEGTGKDRELSKKWRMSQFEDDKLAEGEVVEITPGPASNLICNIDRNAAKVEIDSAVVHNSLVREGDEMVVMVADSGIGFTDVRKMLMGVSNTGGEGIGLRDAQIRARNSGFGLRIWSRVRGENGVYGKWNFFGQDSRGEELAEIAPPMHFIERIDGGRDISVPASTIF